MTAASSRNAAEIERIEALRSNALMMIEHSEAQAARSYWMGQQSAFDAALSVLRDPRRSTETPRVGDRVELIEDGYSEPRGSFATVTEIHREHGNAMTLKWEHLPSTSSVPVWPDHVRPAGPR